MAFTNYTFTNVNVIFGIIELEGFAEGDDVVRIEPRTDAFNLIIGAKGDGARSQTNDYSCTVTIKLLQTSVSNAELNAVYLLDRATGAAAAPMIINDVEIGETYTINNAWININPTILRGQNINPMEWVFQGDILTPAYT